ncbi:MAG: AAA family ATPase [Lachnospiraceae bacterium]|nr:AAA family ATPase [Lachnospiraceae bacterium]
MYIKNIHIENFRNFKYIDIPIKQFTIIIGENDSGKSNLLDAIRLVLHNNGLQYFSRTLGITDLNEDALDEFYAFLNENASIIAKSLDDKEFMKGVYEKIPTVRIRITFDDAKSEYQKQLLKDWVNIDDEDEISYDIEYLSAPVKQKDFIEECLFLQEKVKRFMIPIEKYEYKIYSVNNGKAINKDKAKNFNVSVIDADRDTFSQSDKQNSYRLISSLITKSITSEDRVKVEESYNSFFSEIQNIQSFKQIFNRMKDSRKFENIQEYIDEMQLIPNFPNLKNIFSNINIGIGDEFLYQKGLGTRNLMYLILLFSYFQVNDKIYNFLCIEEPEAHLCVNNFNLILDFIKKSVEIQNDYMQLLITSHNPKVINKLKLNNVVILKNGKAISLQDVDKQLVNYLAKRPNFDILKLLFAKKLILVEGSTEEMFINTLLDKESYILNEIEVIAIGQKGYKTFLDIWLKIHKNDSTSCIGIVRDFDNQKIAKQEHNKYDEQNENIFVRTTEKYTMEDDLVATGNNEERIRTLFKIEGDVSDFLKNSKADNMRLICEAISENKIEIEVPSHIGEIIKCVMEY